MFNLLTDSLKEKIKLEYNLRRLIVAFIFILFIQSAFLVFFFPSWLTSLYKENSLISKTGGESPTSFSNAGPTVSNIVSMNSKLGLINTILAYPEVTPFLDGIISNKTSAIKIIEFVYTSDGKTTGVISLQGISTTRESLVSFVKSLEKSGLFKSVDLPISNFAKNKNIDFSISITIDKPNA